MKTPEQQPTTSSLQSLQNEMVLTKQEMEEFRKLPKEEQEKQKETKLAELQALQTKLDLAMQEAIKTGDLTEVKKLKDQLEQEIVDLTEKVEATEIFFDIEKNLNETEKGKMLEANSKDEFRDWTWDNFDELNILRKKNFNKGSSPWAWGNEGLKKHARDALEILGEDKINGDISEINTLNFACKIKIEIPESLKLNKIDWDVLKNKLKKYKAEENWQQVARFVQAMMILTAEDIKKRYDIPEREVDGFYDSVELVMPR
jgi:hypothetical protein